MAVLIRFSCVRFGASSCKSDHLDIPALSRTYWAFSFRNI